MKRLVHLATLLKLDIDKFNSDVVGKIIEPISEERLLKPLPKELEALMELQEEVRTQTIAEDLWDSDVDNFSSGDLEDFQKIYSIHKM